MKTTLMKTTVMTTTMMKTTVSKLMVINTNDVDAMDGGYLHWRVLMT